MPLPIGHAAIGFATHSLCNGNHSTGSRWKLLLGILILSNLPDVDVALGIVFSGNGNIFHRGPTHSLIFAVIGGFLAHRVCSLSSRLPEFSFRNCFLLILSHILADSFFTTSPVSFFWPIAVNWSPGQTRLGDVANLVLFGNHRDAAIIIASIFLAFFFRAITAVRHLRSLRGPKAFSDP